MSSYYGFKTLGFIWTAFIAYTYFVFHITLTPAEDVPAFVGQYDKLLHMGVFGTLYVLALAPFHSIRTFVRSHRFAAFGYTVVVGGLTEVLQRQTGRQASVLDLAADTLGALLAFFLIKYSAE